MLLNPGSTFLKETELKQQLEIEGKATREVSIDDYKTNFHLVNIIYIPVWRNVSYGDVPIIIGTYLKIMGDVLAWSSQAQISIQLEPEQFDHVANAIQVIGICTSE
jgi:hypothetical protein